jgi:EAL domain-containing protein (putative c-di-GMP-specific phosphodiesterase class I)
MEANARARHALERDLRSAIVHDEFELHFQPIVEIWSGETHGAEALVRWRHPQRGMIAPGDFISLAEEIGLIDTLGEWILNKACSEAASWPVGIKLAVNLSPAQFGRGNLIDIVSGALAKSGLPASRLELEITESVLLQKNAENLAQLHQIQALGVAIVLDDFGTGYSSLSYLNMFPFDKIKIDRSFVAELSSRANSAAIVCAVIGLGQSLNIATTAEGIETEEQLELLRAAGCRLGQGYLFSRPVPATDLKFKRKPTQRDGRAA